MNDFNRRYDFDRERRRKSGTPRLQAILILLAVLAVTGAVIYFIIRPQTEKTENPPQDTGKDAPAPVAVAPQPQPPTENGGGAPASGTPEEANVTQSGEAAPGQEVNTAPETNTADATDVSTESGVNDPLERAIEVIVRPGDTLETIARRHHSTPRSIMHFNDLKNDRIMNGQKLKVIPGPWRMTVIQKRNELILEHAPDGNWRLFRSFPADANGLKGEFAISSMHYHPTWIDAHGGQFKYGEPENPCGDYLLKLAPRNSPRNPLAGYGIHGVDDKTSNLKNCGRGCIHVGSRDIELMYYLVCPGTEVTVTSGETVRNLEK